MKQKYLDIIITVFIVALITFVLFLQISTTQSTDKLKEEELHISKEYATHIAQLIQSKTDNSIVQSLKTKPDLRIELNQILNAFLTKHYQYIFVLYKDENDKYRFLLDASVEDPEEFNALFFPKSNFFDEVYSTGNIEIVEQHDGVEEVWLSLVYPIRKSGKTEALLVLDLSKRYGEYLSDFHSPLMNLIRFMQIFLIFSLLSLIYFIYRYYKVKDALHFDPLTLAYTKQYLIEFFDKKNINEYHIFFIDIDEFKDINKKYGNAFGDLAIQQFANTIKNNLPTNAKVVRAGGTEFIVVIPKKEGELEALSSELFNLLQVKKYYILNEEIKLYVSMSAIEVPEGKITLHAVQRMLDEKLLDIKSKGKNALGIIGLKHIDDVKYSDIDYIKKALEEERLLCLYQPIYDTKTKQIVKYEALVRLIDEETHTYISPYFFMDVIKGTSQYIKMSKLVLNHVFHTLGKYPDIELSMNIDLNDLDNVAMMQLIMRKLIKYKHMAPRLTFEILEETEIKDFEKVQDIFEKLRRYGSKIALDDFGSGYASYNYLIKLDIDILKIDGSLVKELRNYPQRAKDVLSSIQELATKFNYEVVAEFVSHKDIYETVKALNIQYSQGYYLGEPQQIEYYLESPKD